MSLTPGSRTLTPADGDLLLLTSVEGPMARLGHELALRGDIWNATVTIGDSAEATSLQATVDLTSLSVQGSRVPGKTVPEKDRGEILTHAQKALQTQKHGQASFTSTAVRGDWNAVVVDGQLTLHGQTRPQSFRVETTGGGYRLSGQVTQSDYGIKPFAIMMGALKVGDVIDVEITVPL